MPENGYFRQNMAIPALIQIVISFSVYLKFPVTRYSIPRLAVRYFQGLMSGLCSRT
jgi:hypothetical protein